MRKRSILVASLLLLVFVSAACGLVSRGEDPSVAGPAPEEGATEEADMKAQSGGDAGGGGAAGGSGEFAGSRTGGGEGGDGSGGAGGGVTRDRLSAAPSAITAPDLPPLPSIPSASSKVIKSASLEIRVSKGSFGRQFDRATSVAEQFGGFVSSSSVTESDGKLSSGTLTIRVPSNQFQAAVARFKGLGKLTHEEQSGQDVTKEYVDLEARLKQAKAQEAFYLRLMDQAKSISDMIQIQSQLSAVQLRIEEIQGQLQFLQDQTSFSTITARIFEPGAPIGGRPKGLAKAWQDAREGFESVIGGTVVAAGWIAPFGLIALAGFVGYRLVRRSRVRPAAAKPTETSA